MGIKTILAALCSIQIVLVVIKSSAVDKENNLVPKIQEIPAIFQNSTAKHKDPTIPNDESEYYEQYEDRFVDAFAMETTATEQMVDEAEEQAGKDAVNKENNDGRSAYINNKFVSDEELSHVNPTLPLYEVLQQQMEQVLAETAPEYLMYPPPQEDKGTHELKNSTYETLNVYGKANEEDSDENMSTLEKKETDDNDIKIANPFEPNQKPIVEIPKPFYAVNTTTLQSPLLHPTRSENTEKPLLQYEKPTENCHLEIRPTANAIASKDDIAQNYKGHNTYNIVSTSSQVVSTPLADLILKLSIGIAKPLRATYFEDRKIEKQNYGDTHGYNGFKRNLFRGNKNRNAKYRIRKVTSRL